MEQAQAHLVNVRAMQKSELLSKESKKKAAPGRKVAWRSADLKAKEGEGATILERQPHGRSRIYGVLT